MQTKTAETITLTLDRTNDVWLATFSDPGVAELMGTATIPTPYSARTQAADVLAKIASLNPNCEVTVNS